MNNQPPINPEIRLPTPPPIWVRGAFYSSAVTLTASTVAMAVLLAINPQMGIIGFSLITGAEGISCTLFAVSFYLLNRKQDERLANFRYTFPEIRVERPIGKPSSVREAPHESPISSDRGSTETESKRGEGDVKGKARLYPQDDLTENSDSDTEEPNFPPTSYDPDASSKEGERDLPVPDPDVILDATGVKGKRKISSLAEDITDDILPRNDHPIEVWQQIFSNLDRLDDLARASLVCRNWHSIINNERSPTKRLLNEAFGWFNFFQFKKSIPNLLTVTERVLISLVSAQARCKKKAEPKNEIIKIRTAFQQLNIFISQLLNDNHQIFEILLGIDACVSIKRKILSEFVQNNNSPLAFLEHFRKLFKDSKSFNWVSRITEQAAAGIRTQADKKEFATLYSNLQAAEKDMRSTEDTINPAVLVTFPNRYINYFSSLMKIIIWLYMKTNPESSLIKETVKFHITSIFNYLSSEVMDGDFSGDFATDVAPHLAISYRDIKKEAQIPLVRAIFKIIKIKIPFMPSVSSISQNAINQSPLKKDYAEILTTNLINILLPIGMNLLDEALFSDSSKFGTALDLMFDSSPFKPPEKSTSTPNSVDTESTSSPNPVDTESTSSPNPVDTESTSSPNPVDTESTSSPNLVDTDNKNSKPKNLNELFIDLENMLNQLADEFDKLGSS